MKVHELIEALKLQPQDSEVFLFDTKQDDWRPVKRVVFYEVDGMVEVCPYPDDDE